MRRKLTPILAAALLACFTLAATAHAKPLPDNSAVDQYTEAVPTASGQKSSSGGGALPPGTTEAQGNDGTAAADLAKATAPAPTDAGGSETSGMGWLLPLLLIVTLLGAITVFVARRRQDRPAG